MPIIYTKLFDIMKARGLTTYRIRKEKIISEGTLQKLRENKPVSTESIESLCDALDCQPGDFMEYIKDTEGVINE
ncbi:MAG: helix-turn-helix transcriptional regulator [Clostridia bacterium]|nr:helix-turn-helix transcriptional regulator [Clostridia bacterium]